MKALECSQQFFRRARADNSGVGGGIWPKFELIQAFMHVLVTCKNEVDPIKNKKLAASKAYSIPPAMCSCLNIAKFKTL